METQAQGGGDRSRFFQKIRQNSREDGKILWRRVVQAETKIKFHPLNNPASSTPAADEKNVYVYFANPKKIYHINTKEKDIDI